MPVAWLRTLTFMAVLAASVASTAAEPRRVNTDQANVAIDGYDTVAYFTRGKPTKGDDHYETKWEGARWRFVNAEHRELFLRNPERYAPRFGGFCAVGLSRGHLASIDPESWRIVDGKLFLTFNKRSDETLAADIPGTIEKAERAWQSLGVR